MSDVDQTVGLANKGLNDPRNCITLYEKHNSMNTIRDCRHNKFLCEVYGNAVMKIRVLTKLSFFKYLKVHHLIVRKSGQSDTSVRWKWKIKIGEPNSFPAVFLVHQVSLISSVSSESSKASHFAALGPLTVRKVNPCLNFR